MANYILALDQGTTGSTALLINTETKEIIAKSNKEFPQLFPKPSWVEHSLNDIWKSVKTTVLEVIAVSNIDPKQIVSIGITNQRETTCAFDKKGQPLHNAIVWQDRRTQQFCQENQYMAESIKEKTGLSLDPYFSGTKMKWLLENCSEVKNCKTLHLGTIDTFLLYKLTNGNSYLTETTNASRTLLMNLKTSDWDNELLNFFQIKKENLPIIKDSIGHFGITSGLDFLPDGISISCILGDQQSALFGQAGQRKGSFKCTYGTGAFALLNTGEEIIYSSQGLITTSAYSYKGKNYFALEGATYIAGACVQWLRDNLKIINNSSEVEVIASKANDESMTNILMLPFFTGIASPYWLSDAKAALIGLTRDTGIEQIARASLEGIAMSISDLITAFNKDSKISKMRVDGGACANNLLMQMQANFSNTTIIRPRVIETTAYGVGLGCMVAIGICTIEEIEHLWKVETQFKPEDDLKYEEKKYSQWQKAIKTIYK